MYKLLLVTDQPDIQETFLHDINWSSYNCHAPRVLSAVDEAIQYINISPLDAVGYHLGKQGAIQLGRYLASERPSLPVFAVSRKRGNQEKLIAELTRLLDRMHIDDADEPYDEETMLATIRDDYTHRLLCGNIHDADLLKRGLKLIRMDVNTERRCVMYELHVPMGESYISHHSKDALERLERALRNSFIGRTVGRAYYGVAVLSATHIRVVAAPLTDEDSDNIERFAEEADQHMLESINRVKDYLDLEIVISQSGLLDNLTCLVNPKAQGEA